MPEQEVEMSPSGELNFKLPQQEWCGNDVIQIAHFAGQKMIIKRSDDEYELHYLGLKVGGFADIDQAKYNAPEFARSVFQIMGDFIRDSSIGAAPGTPWPGDQLIFGQLRPMGNSMIIKGFQGAIDFSSMVPCPYRRKTPWISRGYSE